VVSVVGNIVATRLKGPARFVRAKAKWLTAIKWHYKLLQPLPRYARRGDQSDSIKTAMKLLGRDSGDLRLRFVRWMRPARRSCDTHWSHTDCFDRIYLDGCDCDVEVNDMAPNYAI